MRSERVRVDDIGTTLAQERLDPTDVARSERLQKIGEGTFASRATVMDAQAGIDEVVGEGSIRRNERHFVIGRGRLGAAGQIGEQSLRASDVASDDNMHDTQTAHDPACRSSLYTERPGRDHPCRTRNIRAKRFGNREARMLPPL
jgi:hypothetical protein